LTGPMSDTTGDEAAPPQPINLVRGGLWLVVVAVMQRAILLLAFLIVARLVAPDQIGLMALVMAFVGIGALVSEFGISAALVQMPDLSQRHVDSAFTLSVPLSLILAAAVAAAAPLIADFYANQALVPLVWLAAVALMLRGCYAPLRGLVLRAQAYKTLALVELAAAFVGAVTTIVIAIGSRDVSSLFFGSIAETAVLLGAGLVYARPLPRRPHIGRESRSFLAFGATVSFSRILDQVSGTLDVLLIGKLFPPAALGLFYTGQRITTLLPLLVTSKLQELMFPHFSRHQDNPEKLHHNFWTAVLASGLLVGLLCALTIACAEPVVLLVLGEEWAGAVPFVWAFATAMFIQGLGGGVIGAFIFGTGKVYMTVWLSIFRITMLPACIFVGAQFGPIGVAWSIAVYYAVGRALSQVIVRWRCGLRLRPAPRVLLQAGIAVATALVPATALRTFLPDNELGALMILAPAVTVAFCAGCAISLLVFHDPETTSVRNALRDGLRCRRLPA